MILKNNGIDHQPLEQNLKNILSELEQLNRRIISGVKRWENCMAQSVPLIRL